MEVAICGRQEVDATTLEFARPLAGPAFDDDFFVGEELDGVAALRVHDAEEAAFPSGEREVGHGRGDADVDADVAGGDGVAELARGRSGGGEDGTGVAVRRNARSCRRLRRRSWRGRRRGRGRRSRFPSEGLRRAGRRGRWGRRRSRVAVGDAAAIDDGLGAVCPRPGR